MVNFLRPGQVREIEIARKTGVARDVSEHRHRAAAMIISPIANPSSPSVKFTAFEEPTMMKTIKR